MSTASISDEAAKFADDFVTFHNALALSRAAYVDVKKKTEARNFYTVHWDTFERGPIDATEVLSKLEADIKDNETAFAAAKEGLEEVLGRMHKGELVLWWRSCERVFSCVEPLKQYKPIVETPVIEEAVEEEVNEASKEEEVEDGTVEERSVEEEKDEPGEMGTDKMTVEEE